MNKGAQVSPDDQFDNAMEKYCSKYGVGALQQRVERGDFIGEQEAKARAFLSKKAQEALTRYQLSPEYSALRQANAAEQANKLSAAANAKAHRAYVMSAIAVVVSLVGLVIQLVKG
ncbi:hypothetical protein [Paenacidovorax monticola]|uniref:Uncharacterized protein n=1 Tax=Paenacidovorax monticola TaxID=1926868 RepID=A0A7H0HFY5_9BURK|nr:hypothetical protein [Paenacidovorax monticola]QNP59451.1 hypothetical protein H9L24_22145 [Paenacidovorax monticola]